MSSPLVKHRDTWTSASSDSFARGPSTCLDGLERQGSAAGFVGLPVPDEFDPALVLEQQKAILLRRRLVWLQIPDDSLVSLICWLQHFVSFQLAAQKYNVPRGSTSTILRDGLREEDLKACHGLGGRSATLHMKASVRTPVLQARLSLPDPPEPLDSPTLTVTGWSSRLCSVTLDESQVRKKWSDILLLDSFADTFRPIPNIITSCC